MAHAIHRVTKQVVADNAQRSEATPYDDAEWFYLSRPDGDAAALKDFANLKEMGIPPIYWNLVDGPPKRIEELSADAKVALEESKLGFYQQQRVDAIDAKNAKLIGQGFEYPEKSGQWFSLQIHSQVNLLNMLMMKDSPEFPYPMYYASINDKDFAVLKNADDIGLFYYAQVYRIAYVKMSSTLIKQQVAATTTLAELAKVVDDR